MRRAPRGFVILLLVALWPSQSLAQTATISTVAGPPLPVAGALATTQALYPSSVVADGSGGFYIGSELSRVYRVAADGSLGVIAGTGAPGYSGDGGAAAAAQIAYPLALALDSAGNLYIADSGNNRIRMVTPQGIISTVAGTGTGAFSGDGGPAIAAEINSPTGVAVDGAGNLFISDSGNNRIRKVAPDGIISTFAGTGAFGSAGDGGPATAALLGLPVGIAVDAAGNVFIGEYLNDRVRKITAGGTISTVAGTVTGFGGDGGPATAALLSSPVSVAVDGAGNLFIGDFDNNRIRRVDAAGTISTFAGTSEGFGGDGGPATAAQISGPVSIAAGHAGSLLIVDYGNGRIRQVAANGQIATIAGKDFWGFSGDGGPAAEATLLSPAEVAVDPMGNIYIADTFNHRIRKVAADGTISTVAGAGTQGFSGDNGPATAAELSAPEGVAVDAHGNIFIADSQNNRVRKLAPDGIISTIAGNGAATFGGDGGPATAASLFRPQKIAVNGAGELFVTDSFNNRIRKIGADGVIATIAGSATAGFAGDGGPAAAARTNIPLGIAIDSAGNLFFTDLLNNRVRRISTEGVISTVAGNGVNGFSGDGGPAISAQLTAADVAVDGAGNLFIADFNNNRIRKVTPDGIISTISGDGVDAFLGDGGPAAAAELSSPLGVAVDLAGNLFIADANNSRIRKITFTKTLPFTFIERGGTALASSGAAPALTVGYASVRADPGSTTPAGLAIFQIRQNDTLVSEATVPASGVLQSGRIYAEVDASVKTGLGIANPNNQPATITFFFSDSNGDFGNGAVTIPPNGQIAGFLDQAPYHSPALMQGAFTFNASVPVAVIALRGLFNERGEFLVTTLPVANLSLPAASSAIVFPDFADGGGWTSQVVLVNSGDTPLAGTVRFVDKAGIAAGMVVDGQFNTSFAYAIPPRSSQKMQTAGAGTDTVTGSVRVEPSGGSATPSGLAIFSFRRNEVTVSEVGVPAAPAGTAFRLYAEVAGPVQSGLAVANPSAQPVTVTLELTTLDGVSSGLTGSLEVPGNGQSAIFLSQIEGFAALETPFQGILRVTSTVPIYALGIRGRYNERGDFLAATTPPVDEAAPSSTAPLYFPHIADSLGYTTQFILFSGHPGQTSAGSLQLFSQAGGALNWTVQ